MFCQTQIIRIFLVLLCRWPYQSFLPSAAVVVYCLLGRSSVKNFARRYETDNGPLASGVLVETCIDRWYRIVLFNLFRYGEPFKDVVTNSSTLLT